MLAEPAQILSYNSLSVCNSIVHDPDPNIVAWIKIAFFKLSSFENFPSFHGKKTKTFRPLLFMAKAFEPELFIAWKFGAKAPKRSWVVSVRQNLEVAENSSS